MKEEAINCIKCKNFYVTWDVSFPKGCKLFDFKSKQMPSVLVQQATGTPCRNFVEKAKEK